MDWEPFKRIYCQACVRACMHKAIELKGHVSSPGYKVGKKTFKA